MYREDEEDRETSVLALPVTVSDPHIDFAAEPS